MDAEMTALSRSLVVELAGSIGFRDSPLANRIIWPLFRPVTDRLARIGLSADITFCAAVDRLPVLAALDAGGAFLHEMRRTETEVELFAVCDRHLLADPARF